MLPLILAPAGPELTAAERAFFRDADPAGFILFARNVTDRAGTAALTASLRECVGRDAPILIDQEGGRVARLAPPNWPAFPAAAAFGRLYAKAPMSAIEAVRLNALALAATLRDVGVDVDCIPVLDVPAPDCHAIIGDRAFADDPMWIAALGSATLRGLAAGGVAGVVKHLPGHGRARADSHRELPVVDASDDELARDLEPFAKLAGVARMGMTAHVVYTAWDAERCASLSPVVIAEVIRGRVGFDGWLMSDDLDMAALSGTLAERALGVLAAGCDVALQCNGDLAAMEALAAAVPAIGEASAARMVRARDGLGTQSADPAELALKRDALLAYA